MESRDANPRNTKGDEEFRTSIDIVELKTLSPFSRFNGESVKTVVVGGNNTN